MRMQSIILTAFCQAFKLPVSFWPYILLASELERWVMRLAYPPYISRNIMLFSLHFPTFMLLLEDTASPSEHYAQFEPLTAISHSQLIHFSAHTKPLCLT